MKFIDLLKRLFRLCEHDFIFIKAIDEQSLRGGYAHRSRIYECRKCFKRDVREDFTL